jgi:prepilin-type N-terminal cleavage/methylation domain-containing protein
MSVRSRRQSGLTLIETLVALVLLGVIVVTVLGAFSSATVAATRHQQLTSLDRLTRSEVEYIKSQTYDSKPTAYSDLSAAGYSFSSTILYYDPNANPTWSVANTDNGLQQIRLTATGPNGITETLYFLKVQP